MIEENKIQLHHPDGMHFTHCYKPLFERGQSKAISEVVRGDNMEFMAKFPDNFFDLAIVDPPYGIGASSYERGGTQYGNSKAKCKEYTKKDWDSKPPDRAYFVELFRCSKKVIVWGANHFIENIPNSNSSCWIVWDKDNGEGSGYADCELAWTNFDTAVRRIKWRWAGMLQQDMKNKEERIHPTQKPKQLYKLVLKRYAKEGQKILDTHLGSQSSRIAAWEMAFDFWGCELDDEHFIDGCNRFERETKQLSLWAG